MHGNFKEFIVGSHTYRAGKLDAMTQFHVSRRILPVFVGLAKGEGSMMDQFRGAAEALASLNDDDANYVISRCLSVVQRKLNGDSGWASVWSQSANRLMMDDIDMVQMLQMAGEVLGHNLGNFIQSLPSEFQDLMKNSDTNP